VNTESATFYSGNFRMPNFISHQSFGPILEKMIYMKPFIATKTEKEDLVKQVSN
jgi:hypothetical protein